MPLLYPSHFLLELFKRLFPLTSLRYLVYYPLLSDRSSGVAHDFAYK